MTPAARVQAAIELLDEIIAAARDAGAAADTLIARYFKERRYAGSKDRRAVRELIYAAIRRCGNRPESGRAALLGLVQDRPELAVQFDGSAHGPAPIAAEEAVAPAALLPDWIIPRLAGIVGPDEHAALLERATLDIRVNRLKADMAIILPQLEGAEPIPGFPDGLRLPEGTAVEGSPQWEAGLIEVQDAGSQLISATAQAQPGMTVIDLCAGAGGKTLAMAAGMAGPEGKVSGRIIACDTSRPRLQRLPERAERAGVAVETLLLNPGKEAEMLAPLRGQADVVLVDAPCSGTGTWRRNPEARWRLTPERLDKLVSEQARILDFAAPLVKPGGRLVFAVCALTEAEGRGQAEAFLARHGGWQVEPIAASVGRAWGAGRLLSPAHDGTDGFFMAAMVKA